MSIGERREYIGNIFGESTRSLARAVVQRDNCNAYKENRLSGAASVPSSWSFACRFPEILYNSGSVPVRGGNRYTDKDLRIMNEEPIKICLQCGAEYSLEAVACADCGGTLVFPQEYEKRAIPLEEAEAEILIRQSTVSYLKELDDLLKREGIRSAIRFHGCEPGT